jgi:spore coat polysaccharide biosynthesis predicted glycosyltransferase SpsG
MQKFDNVILRLDVDNGEFAGTGHLSRTSKIIFFLKKNYKINNFFFLVKKLNGTEKILKKFKNIKIIYYDIFLRNKINFSGKKNILVCDTPFGSNKKLKLFCLKKKIDKIILIDDFNKSNIKNCIIFNGILSFKKKIKKRNEYKILQGPDYVLLDKKYKNSKIKSKNKILICTGGTDNRNLLSKILKNLENKNNKKIIVIIGSLVKKNNPVFKIQNKNITYIYRPSSLYKYFNQSITCILTGGITMFEALALKKNILVIQNYNHQKYAINFFNNQGFVKKIGNFKRINFIKMNNLVEKKKIKKIKKIIDGKGLYRIENEIKNYLAK